MVSFVLIIPKINVLRIVFMRNNQIINYMEKYKIQSIGKLCKIIYSQQSQFLNLMYATLII